MKGIVPWMSPVAELVEPYRQRNVMMIWCVHPTTTPDMRTALTRAGLVNAEEIFGMAAEVRHLPHPPTTPSDVEVIEASVDHTETWVDFVSGRYGLEPAATPFLEEVYRKGIGVDVRLWLAMIDGHPVSKVAMHVAGGVAGIYGVATNDSGRGKGLASLLTLTAIEAAPGRRYRARRPALDANRAIPLSATRVPRRRPVRAVGRHSAQPVDRSPCRQVHSRQLSPVHRYTWDTDRAGGDSFPLISGPR